MCWSICPLIYALDFLSSSFELVATESTDVFEDVDFTYKLAYKELYSCIYIADTKLKLLELRTKVESNIAKCKILYFKNFHMVIICLLACD